MGNCFLKSEVALANEIGRIDEKIKSNSDLIDSLLKERQINKEKQDTVLKAMSNEDSSTFIDILVQQADGIEKQINQAKEAILHLQNRKTELLLVRHKIDNTDGRRTLVSSTQLQQLNNDLEKRLDAEADKDEAISEMNALPAPTLSVDEKNEIGRLRDERLAEKMVDVVTTLPTTKTSRQKTNAPPTTSKAPLLSLTQLMTPSTITQTVRPPSLAPLPARKHTEKQQQEAVIY